MTKYQSQFNNSKIHKIIQLLYDVNFQRIFTYFFPIQLIKPNLSHI